MDHHAYWGQRLSRGRGLGSDREQELAAILSDPLASLGDRQHARDELVTGNTVLVLQAARKAERRGVTADFESLVSAGIAGLMEAAARYKPGRGRFSTAAMYWVNEAIGKEAASAALPIEVDRRLWAAAIRKAETGAAEETASRDRHPKAAGTVAVFLSPVRIDGGIVAAEDHPPSSAGDPGDIVAVAQTKSLRDWIIREALMTLSAKEREIIERRYGFGCWPAPASVVAAAMGIDQSHMYQVEKQARGRIRAYVEAIVGAEDAADLIA